MSNLNQKFHKENDEFQVQKNFASEVVELEFTPAQD